MLGRSASSPWTSTIARNHWSGTLKDLATSLRLTVTVVAPSARPLTSMKRSLRRAPARFYVPAQLAGTHHEGFGQRAPLRHTVFHREELDPAGLAGRTDPPRAPADRRPDQKPLRYDDRAPDDDRRQRVDLSSRSSRGFRERRRSRKSSARRRAWRSEKLHLLAGLPRASSRRARPSS